MWFARERAVCSPIACERSATKTQPCAPSPSHYLRSGRACAERAALSLAEGFRDLRYMEGRNIALEVRFARGDLAQGRRLSVELVAAPVDVIVTEGFIPDAAAVTERIPVVAARPGTVSGSVRVTPLSRKRRPACLGRLL